MYSRLSPVDIQPEAWTVLFQGSASIRFSHCQNQGKFSYIQTLPAHNKSRQEEALRLGDLLTVMVGLLYSQLLSYLLV
jgi:hypothetical protein